MHPVAVQEVEEPGERHARSAVDHLELVEQLLGSAFSGADFGEMLSIRPHRDDRQLTQTTGTRVLPIAGLEHPVLAKAGAGAARAAGLPVREKTPCLTGKFVVARIQVRQ
ncbi:MAG: hypothetical protein DI604_11735 [Delftia acidovorans]|nr:MAG: hypothetical protein DI604_11735 [Delftia acidovorans]